MPYTPTLDMSARYPASAEIVWAALTKRRYTSEWWPSLDSPMRAHARFRIQTPRPRKKRPRSAFGRIQSVSSSKNAHEAVVRITSEPRGFDSKVTITVSQLKHRTRVRIVESGLPDGDYAEIVAAECREGWRDLLSSLDDYLGDERTVARIARHLRGR